MGATTPLWVTVLLAVLSPVLTLIGVLWTQRAADRRAVQEATLRIAHEREKAVVDRVHAVYDDMLGSATTLFEKAHSKEAWDRAYLDFHGVLIRARVVAPKSVEEAGKAFLRTLDETHALYTSNAESAEKSSKSKAAFERLDALQSAIRTELTSPPSPTAK